MDLIIVLDIELNGWLNLLIDGDSFSSDELYELNVTMYALLDNEVSQPEVNKGTADLCNLLYT